MRTVSYIFTTIVNYVLYQAAFVLPIMLALPNLISQIIVNSNKKSTLYVASKKAKEDAVNINIFFNKSFKDLWKTVLVKKGYWGEIGKDGETLSYLTAKAWRDDMLLWSGYFTGSLLNIVFFSDWFRGGHLKYTIKLYET